MTISNLVQSKAADGSSQSLLDIHIDAFLSYLRAQGYAERTLRNKRTIVASFARWVERQQVAMTNLDDSHISAYANETSQCSRESLKSKLAALQAFFGYLRAEAVLPTPAAPSDTSPAANLQKRYLDYLRSERGLAENSILVYRPFITDFLTDQVADTGLLTPEAWGARTVQDFILKRIRNQSSEYARLLASALRSFFRFIYVRGETALELTRAVPPVRRRDPTTLPVILSPEEVANTLAVTDGSTPRRQRDYAILLLLARLGLRAGEIVSLKLDDIHWRSGEIVVHGKGRVCDLMPLPADVGEALARHLRNDRGTSISREVFLRMLAPRVALAGPGAIGHIVRLALARADIHKTTRGAAHLYRHSLATTMLRQGASTAEIAQVLRHRSFASTAIYAKVDFEKLRGVARSWPVAGGV